MPGTGLRERFRGRFHSVRSEINREKKDDKHMSSFENVEVFEDTKKLCETTERLEVLARS